MDMTPRTKEEQKKLDKAAFFAFLAYLVPLIVGFCVCIAILVNLK